MVDDVTEEEFREDFGRAAHTDEELEEFLNRARSAGDADFRLAIKQLHVMEWWSLHRAELAENWRLAQEGRPPKAIAPLE